MLLQGEYIRTVISTLICPELFRKNLLNFLFLRLRLVDMSDGSPAWGDAGVIMTWHMYRMYGDTQIIIDNYKRMQAWLHYISVNNSDFIWRNRLNHNYGDWLSVDAPTPKILVSTAFYAYDALLMSKMAKAIDKTADAQMYKQLHTNISLAFNREFVDKTSAQITNRTQCDYVLALAFELLPESLVSKAVLHLVEGVRGRNWHLSTGFIGEIQFKLRFQLSKNRIEHV